MGFFKIVESIFHTRKDCISTYVSDISVAGVALALMILLKISHTFVWVSNIFETDNFEKKIAIALDDRSIALTISCVRFGSMFFIAECSALHVYAPLAAQPFNLKKQRQNRTTGNRRLMHLPDGPSVICSKPTKLAFWSLVKEKAIFDLHRSCCSFG